MSIRQTQIDVAEVVHHSFAFSFRHAHLFRNGHMPTKGKEIKNSFYVEQDARKQKGYILEEYSHYESAAFELSIFNSRLSSHYLYLGFDLDFSPVCLITSKNIDDISRDDESEPTNHDFTGMYQRADTCLALSKLLSTINAPLGSEVVLAFKVRPGKLSTIQCQDLSLRIDFKLKDTRQVFPDVAIDGKIWHITFDSINNTVPSLPPIRRFRSAPDPIQERSSDTAVKRARLIRFFSMRPSRPERTHTNVSQWLGRVSNATIGPPSTISSDDSRVTTVGGPEEFRIYPKLRHRDVYESDSAQVSHDPFRSETFPLRSQTLATFHELDAVHRSELHPAHTTSPLVLQPVQDSGQTIPVLEIEEDQPWQPSPLRDLPRAQKLSEDFLSPSHLIPRKALPPGSSISPVSNMTRDDHSAI